MIWTPGADVTTEGILRLDSIWTSDEGREETIRGVISGGLGVPTGSASLVGLPCGKFDLGGSYDDDTEDARG